MTLKEKFNALVPKEFGGMQEPTLSECTQIADDYAIEFAEWIINGKINKELLKIFKIEKGL